MKKDFHDLILQSILFKGRGDWYFCYLKSEKIAHVLVLLLEKSDSPLDLDFKNTVDRSITLPSLVLEGASGGLDTGILLSEVLSLLTSLRLLGTKGKLGKETAQILIDEYEGIARKLAAEHPPSPFVSIEDFEVPESLYMREQSPLPSSAFAALPETPLAIKDSNKGQETKRDRRPQTQEMTPGDRAFAVLDVVRKNNGVSIKDIASVVRNCSAKTIQRELGSLIEKGLVRREGERRWSLYFATPQS